MNITSPESSCTDSEYNSCEDVDEVAEKATFILF